MTKCAFGSCKNTSDPNCSYCKIHREIVGI